MFGNMYAMPPLGELRREMDRLLDSFGGFVEQPGRFGTLRRGAYPAINVWEDADHFFLEAECPGVALDALDLTVTGRQLTVSGSRNGNIKDEAAYHRRERGTGSFSRVVTLPSDVNTEQVEASLKHGVLTVKLAKAEEAKPRQIKVNQ